MKKEDCKFCHFLNIERIILKDDIVTVFISNNPINKYHVIVAPNEHYEKFTELPIELLSHVLKITQDLSKTVVKVCDPDAVTYISDDDLKGESYNLVNHFKMHIIPRFNYDKAIIDFGKLRIKVTDEELINFTKLIRENL